MVKFNAHFDGKVIVPDEPVSLLPNQKLRISIESVEVAPFQPAELPKRVLGQQRDLVVSMTPDWDEPLPDEFWAHNDLQDKP